MKPLHKFKMELPEDVNPMGLRHEVGWTGAFTRKQAEGAIKNGTAIRKRECDPDDTQPLGTIGKVLGSYETPPEALADIAKKMGRQVRFFYFVEWMTLPKHAVGLCDWKIEPAIRQ